MMLSLLVWTLVAVTPAASFTTPEYLPSSPGFGDHDGAGFHGFSCPDGWTMHSVQCLRYNPQEMSWAQAKRHCESLQGTLASVFDEMMAGELHQELTQAGHEPGPVWVGGYRSSERSSWSWTDGLGFSQFADFCGGASAPQDCLQISFHEHQSGCLGELQCEVKLPSVCGTILL
ncbi:type-2 ice-structuring protein [Austrofundulus limnaeus]|uniref:Type-2 ice-structuring protein n=1 Tax=Austrofundulus limnaeus TaxID=52670 RepID=A0A2I4AMV2_AUSLI|nr:PREDICTED: type-2 ice-structuring protein-like [Austrofundulus limnaeus]